MIAFAVYSRSQWTIVRETVRRLVWRGERSVLVWFGPAGAAQEEITIQAAGLGCKTLSHEAYAAVAPDALPAHTRIPGAAVADVLPHDHPYRQLVRRQIAGADRLLQDAAATVLVVCEDGPGGDGALIRAAHGRGLRVLVLPFGVGESRDYDVFLEDKHREGSLNLVPTGEVGQFLRAHASHWIRPTPWGDVLLFPSDFVAARVLEGLDLPRPWAVQGGVADRLAVESPAMHRLLAREGAPSGKLADVGTVYCDVLYDAMHSHATYLRASETGERIDPSVTSVLISLPPSYHDSRAGACEYPTYEEMCAAVIGGCQRLRNVRVTLSVHPNSNEKSRNILESSGVQVSKEWLVSLIPRHDIFFTDFSSTIRWAIAAGKPVVNYDTYAFGLQTYAEVPGVMTSTRLAEAMERMRSLAEDPKVYGDAVRQQQSASADWGCLDGKNFERISGLIHDMRQRQE